MRWEKGKMRMDTMTADMGWHSNMRWMIEWVLNLSCMFSHGHHRKTKNFFSISNETHLSRPSSVADAAKSCPSSSDRWSCSVMRLYCSTMWLRVDCLKLCYHESTCCWWESLACRLWRWNHLENDANLIIREGISGKFQACGFGCSVMHAPHSPHACLCCYDMEEEEEVKSSQS